MSRIPFAILPSIAGGLTLDLGKDLAQRTYKINKKDSFYVFSGIIKAFKEQYNVEFDDCEILESVLDTLVKNNVIKKAKDGYQREE